MDPVEKVISLPGQPTKPVEKKDFYLEPMMSDKDAYNEVNDWYLTMRNYREAAGLVDRWTYYFRLYKSRITDAGKENDYPYISKIFVPYTFNTVETILSKTLSATLASKPYISVFGRSPDDQKSAPAVEELLNYQLDQMDSFFSKELLFQKQNFQFGKSFKKIYWKYKKIINSRGEDIVIFDGPDMDIVPVWDTYVDPGVDNLQDANCLIHCTFQSSEYLKQMESMGLYKNIDKALENAQKASGGEKELQDKLNILGSADDPRYYVKKKQYQVKEYWSRDKLLVVVGQEVVRNTRNPFSHSKIPFVDCNSYPLVGQFYGMGDIEPVSSLQEEINDIRNARMDNINLMIHQVFLANRLSGIDDEVILSPGLVINCDDINGIKQLEMRDMQNSAIRAEENLKVDFQTTSGVTDYSKGQATPGFADTATGVALLSEASNSRFDIKVRLLQESFMKMAEQIIGLDMQFIKAAQLIRVLGPDGAINWKTVTPSDISRQFDYVPIGSTSMGNKQLRQQMIINLFGMLAKVPGINLINFALRVLKEAEVKNPESLFMGDALAQAKQMENAQPQPPVPPGGQGAGISPLLSLGGAGGMPMGMPPAPPTGMPGMGGPTLAPMGIPQGEGVVGTGGTLENLRRM